MLLIASRIAFVVALAACTASILYLLWAILSVRLFQGRRAVPAGRLAPVTVLKPVCGLDPGLYPNLRSFCEQDYPEYQVIFGVHAADDPAVTVIERVIRDLPGRDLKLVVDERAIGTNGKVANLVNMYAHAKHDILVMADSDMRVEPGYLKAVVAPFDAPEVGAVTCLYKSSPVGGLASVMGSMFINEWFLPSVLVALTFMPVRFCFGATMAVRRTALEAIGGFTALASHIADDYMLGKLVTDRGFKVAVAPYVVENVVLEPDLKTLVRHELRWARTVRLVQPLGYSFSFVTNGVTMALLFLLVSDFSALGFFLLAVVLALRILLHYYIRAAFAIRGLSTPWLVPLRDILGFLVWCGSFFGRDVHWREQSFLLGANGELATKG